MWSSTRCGPAWSRAEDGPWSSARAHLAAEGDGLVDVESLLSRVPDWRSLLVDGLAPVEAERFRQHSRTGRPCWSADWIESLERQPAGCSRDKGQARSRDARIRRVKYYVPGTL